VYMQRSRVGGAVWGAAARGRAMAKVCRSNMENKGVCQELDGSANDAGFDIFVCYVITAS
jgi:hypothetical protein